MEISRKIDTKVGALSIIITSSDPEVADSVLRNLDKVAEAVEKLCRRIREENVPPSASVEEWLNLVPAKGSDVAEGVVVEMYGDGCVELHWYARDTYTGTALLEPCGYGRLIQPTP